MDGFDLLLIVLEASLKKNGDQPLTVNHLKNIVKMVRKKQEELEHAVWMDVDINW